MSDSCDSYLSTISVSDAKFDQHKLVSQTIAHLYGLTSDQFEGFTSGNRLVNFSQYAVKIGRCGHWLKFVKTPDGLKLVEANFCKSPNCPMCQWRRSLKWRAKFLELLPSVQENYPTHKWVFLTLTIRDCELDDLKDTVRHLNGSFKRLSETVRFPMVGMVKSLEVTRKWHCFDSFSDEYLGCHGSKFVYAYEKKHNTALTLESSNEVHPHLHIAGLVKSSYFKNPNYITQEEWTEMWKKALRVDYKPMVNIKVVKPKKNKSIVPTLEDLKKEKLGNEISDNSMIAAICETLKYTVKEQDLIGQYCTDKEENSLWLKKITQQLYKTRRVEYRGVLKELGKQLEAAYNDDDLITVNEDKEKVEETDLQEITFIWQKAISRYILSDLSI